MFPQKWIIVLGKPALGAQWENVPWGWELGWQCRAELGCGAVPTQGTGMG